MVRYLFVKFFQAIGLVLIPVGLLYGIASGDLGLEFKIFILGVLFFGIGWGLEKIFSRNNS